MMNEQRNDPRTASPPVPAGAAPHPGAAEHAAAGQSSDALDLALEQTFPASDAVARY